MTYVDGFVLPVPSENVEKYRAMSEKAGKIWMEYGALAYKECVIEDASANEMCSTFPAAFGTKEGEKVIFAFITFTSRQHRDEVNAKVMADPRIAETCGGGDMPFDTKRMAYGGFQSIVDY